jgi:hypothetical protein
MANLDNDHPLVFDTSDWSHFHIDMDSVGFYVDMGNYTNGVQFSSDGTKLYIGWAASGYQHLAVINASTWEVIEDFDPSVIGETFQPPDSSAIYLSPDQNKIVFQNSANYGTTDIYYLCNISSGTPVGIDIIFPQGFAYPNYKPGAAWKADSSEFACVVNPIVGENPRFYAVDAETGAKTNITVSDLEDVLHHSVDAIPTPTPPSPSPTPEWTSLQTWGINDPVTFKLWADKELVATRTVTSNAIFRLPTGYKADKFELGVEGNVRIRSIHVAETPRGLKEI